MGSKFSLLLILASVGLLSACGSSGGGGGGATTTTVVTTGTGVVSVPSSTGFYAQTQNFVTPGYSNSGSSFTAAAGMTSILQNMMGVCNRAAQTGGFSGGYAACGQWQSGAHDMVVYTPSGSTSNTVKLIIRSTPAAANNYSWYSYSVPDFTTMLLNVFGFSGNQNYSGVFDPMVLDATIWPINSDSNGNSQGFEIRANGPTGSYGWNKVLQLIVPNGKMEDPGWGFSLYVTDASHLVSVTNSSLNVPSGALKAASGGSVRCQSQYCGMDASYFGTGY